MSLMQVSELSCSILEGEIEPGDVFNWYSEIDIVDSKCSSSVILKIFEYDPLLFNARK